MNYSCGMKETGKSEIRFGVVGLGPIGKRNRLMFDFS
jgi:hypothetical protein